MMESTADTVMVYDMAIDQVVLPALEDGAQFLSKTNNLGPELASLWESEAFMDVELICTGNKVVRAHRVVLAALSPFFRKMFMDWGPAMETDINIVLAEVEAESIKGFLQKVYQGDLSIAVTDPSLIHLNFDGEVLKEPVRNMTEVADMVKNTVALIKSEPGPSYDDLESLFLEPTIPASKKAKVWKYFTIIDKENSACRLCQTKLKTKNGCTSGISRHMSRMHPNIQIDDLELKEEPNEPDQEDHEIDHGNDDEDPSYDPMTANDYAAAKPVGGKKSKIWNFFARLEKDLARCKSCEVSIKTQKGNTTGMTRHLLRAHSEMYSQLENMKMKDSGDLSENEDEDDDDFSPFKGLSLKSGQGKKRKKPMGKTTRKRANQKRSKVWQFFEQQPDGTEAKCNTCLIMIKTDMGNTSGLISHLRSSHSEHFEELSALRGEGGAEESSASTGGARNSPVWQYYEELGNNRVKCIKCNVVLKYYYGTTSGLLRHLRRSHADAYDTIKQEDNTGNMGNVVESNSAMDVDNETIWKFFHKGENDAANCVECMLEISNQHGSLVTSCEEHLRGSHTDLLEQYESQRKAYVQELIKSDKTAIKRRYTSRVVASAIWSFFKKTEDSALNQCLTCLVEIDCSQNTTAMVKHLEDAHPEQHESFKKQSGIDAKDIKVPSAIWKHFLRTEDPKKHKCIVSTKYPNVLGRVVLTIYVGRKAKSKVS